MNCEVDFTCYTYVDLAGNSYHGVIDLTPQGHMENTFYFQCTEVRNNHAAFALAKDPDFEEPYGCALADKSQRNFFWQHKPLAVNWTQSGRIAGSAVMITSLLVSTVIVGLELRQLVIDGHTYGTHGRWQCGETVGVIFDDFLELFSIRRF